MWGAKKLDYEAYSKFLKALADPKRLAIVDLLSNGTMCACEILDHFDFTQPTLSHHMKVLQSAGVVLAEKRGRWQHYSLADDFTVNFPEFTRQLLQKTQSNQAGAQKLAFLKMTVV